MRGCVKIGTASYIIGYVLFFNINQKLYRILFSITDKTNLSIKTLS